MPYAHEIIQQTGAEFDISNAVKISSLRSGTQENLAMVTKSPPASQKTRAVKT